MAASTELESTSTSTKYYSPAKFPDTIVFAW